MSDDARTAPGADQTAMFADLAIRLVRSRVAAPSLPITVPDGFDVHGFIRFAGNHGAAAALADGTRNAGLAGPYAAGLQMMLDALQQSNAQKNRKLLQGLKTVGGLLDDQAIECVVLKGGAFIAEDTDQCAPWRSTSDIDLLVHGTAIHAAADCLISAGFRLTADRDLYRQEDHQHFPALVCPQTGTSVELHTRALWDPGRDPLDPADIFAQGRPTAITGISLPDATHRLSHLIAHCQISDKLYPARRFQLKDLVDFAELSSRHQIDWQALEDSYRQIGRLPELHGFMAVCDRLVYSGQAAHPLDTSAGNSWARHALQNFFGGTSHRGRMAVDIAADYFRRVVLRPAGPVLLLKTITNPARLKSLFTTHYKKWKN